MFPDGLFIGLDCFESDLHELESSDDEVGGARLLFEKNSSTIPTGKTGSILKEEGGFLWGRGFEEFLGFDGFLNFEMLGTFPRL